MGVSRSIVVNVRALAHRLTGVERYTHELTSRLKGKIVTVGHGWKYGGGLGHVWEQVELPRKVSSADILWSPANTGPLSVPNQVVTVHDLGPLEHPEWFTPSFAAWYGYLIPRLVNRVRLLLTISEFSKNRIVELLKVPEEKVVVIQPGIDTNKFRPRADAVDGARAKSLSLPERYILFVGTLEPRKNLDRLVQAWQLIRLSTNAAHTKIELVLVGSPGKSFRSIDTNRWPTDVRMLGYVDDIDLPGVYAGAMAFILPSLYEGFGLPVLEAMACGIPVLVSKNTTLAEVSADAAVQFDPMSVNDIASALCKVIEDNALRQYLRLKGLERAQGFSWDQAAEKVLEVINGCD
jgi:glycosyltransferase involved in cell wall biosynthesis